MQTTSLCAISHVANHMHKASKHSRKVQTNDRISEWSTLQKSQLKDRAQS